MQGHVPCTSPWRVLSACKRCPVVRKLGSSCRAQMPVKACADLTVFAHPNVRD